MNDEWKEGLIKAVPYLAVFGGMGIVAYTASKVLYRAKNTLDDDYKELYSDYDDDYMRERNNAKYTLG